MPGTTLIDPIFELGDVRQVAVFLAVIQAISDQEGVRHLKTAVVDFDGQQPLGRVVQQCADFQTGGP